MNEKEALLNQERLKMVIEGFRMGFWEWNLITGVVERNKHWAEMLGYSPEEFKNDADAWTKILHPEDKDKVWNAVDEYLSGYTDFFKMEYRIRAKNGKYKWIVDVAKIVQRNEFGKAIKMSGVHMDITEQKNYEEEREGLVSSLQKALKEINVLKGIIPICLYCHNIRSENGSWDKLENYITKHSNAQFSHSICPDCLSMARKEAGLDK